jgi:hypothetical protein
MKKSPNEARTPPRSKVAAAPPQAASIAQTFILGVIPERDWEVTKVFAPANAKPAREADSQPIHIVFEMRFARKWSVRGCLRACCKSCQQMSETAKAAAFTQRREGREEPQRQASRQAAKPLAVVAGAPLEWKLEYKRSAKLP